MSRIPTILMIAWLFAPLISAESRAESNPKPLRAGAWSVDTSPLKFPVIVNGGFLAARADRVQDPLKARCVVLDDGAIRIAIVVVDVCMMPRELIDKAKQEAHKQTGIPVDRMLVSATHTHTAGSCMPALGTPVDPAYAELLPGRISDVIVQANLRVKPAEAGWAVIDDPAHTHNRRWIRKPNALIEDPFGVKSARAHMHPGYVNPDAIAPSGPVDPGLTVLSIRSKDGKSDIVLANYSMHYYGSQPVSADYYGRFSDRLAAMIGGGHPDQHPLVMMSQGTSGDLMWMDYGAPKKDPGLDRYADEVAQVALRAYKTIQYSDTLPIAMAEQTLKLGRRLPDEKRLAWAREMIAKMEDREPRSIPEVYAKEAIYLHEEPARELKLQAVRIGDLGITAIPNEVYAITGLKLKAQSPLATTMNIELANGGDGYIPPPEQHALGGYTTWPARTAGLEVQAEPRIVETVLTLLEKVAEKPRKKVVAPRNRYADAVLASKPSAFWRLDDMAGSKPVDSSGNGQGATLEPGFALYLPGADGPGFATTEGPINRGVHLAGGQLSAVLRLGKAHSVEFWFWNGLPLDARPVAGVLASVGDGDDADSIALGGGGGSSNSAGRLVRTRGKSGSSIHGKTQIPLKTWTHLALVRDGERLTVHLNGNPTPEFAVGGIPIVDDGKALSVVVGNGGDLKSSFEGKIDEVAVYDRALSPEEIAEHYRAAMAQVP